MRRKRPVLKKSGRMRSWIVYLDEDDKVGATENDHSGHAEHNMRDLGWTVLGYVLFKDEDDAIKYAKEVFL